MSIARLPGAGKVLCLPARERVKPSISPNISFYLANFLVFSVQYSFSENSKGSLKGMSHRQCITRQAFNDPPSNSILNSLCLQIFPVPMLVICGLRTFHTKNSLGRHQFSSIVKIWDIYRNNCIIDL